MRIEQNQKCFTLSGRLVNNVHTKRSWFGKKSAVQPVLARREIQAHCTSSLACLQVRSTDVPVSESKCRDVVLAQAICGKSRSIPDYELYIDERVILAALQRDQFDVWTPVYMPYL